MGGKSDAFSVLPVIAEDASFYFTRRVHSSLQCFQSVFTEFQSSFIGCRGKSLRTRDHCPFSCSLLEKTLQHKLLPGGGGVAFMMAGREFRPHWGVSSVWRINSFGTSFHVVSLALNGTHKLLGMYSGAWGQGRKILRQLHIFSLQVLLSPERK